MPSGYLLDTNIVSYLLDGRNTILIERISEVDEWQLWGGARNPDLVTQECRL